MEVYVPRVALVSDDHGGRFIVLECACGFALPYPGHPEELDAVQCDRCGTTWRVVQPVALLDRQGVEVPK